MKVMFLSKMFLNFVSFFFTLGYTMSDPLNNYYRPHSFYLESYCGGLDESSNLRCPLQRRFQLVHIEGGGGRLGLDEPLTEEIFV